VSDWGESARRHTSSDSGNVLRDQHRLFGRDSGARLRNPDWLALAESFDLTAATAGTANELAARLQWALALDAPALIVVPVDAEQERSPWPLLMPAPGEAA
jgi:acetolactate synthase I/II/III large subunit